MFSKIEYLFSKIQTLLLWTISVALLAMMCIIFAQVFTRYVIFYSLPWSEELSRYLFVFIIIIGINIAVSKDKLIKIDAIQTVVKSIRGRAAVAFLHAVIGMVASILIASYATDLFPVGHVQKSPAMRIPMIIMYSIVFSGYVLSTIALFFKACEQIRIMTDPATKGKMISKEEELQEVMNKE
ncbi:Neu5Ac permease [Anaerobiospirillum thomasii]|uniref:TRAP transporter small permease protein n=1 Tax=Anaerobiospirillum thomasii TaxID=179995 RepID=A0A2X0VL47_9GAMM|nr:TRAP transporter small permease [Anaerobiospirillum thomasii]SPT68460.1 Neu5Ac permease [Anaerobiospirillum thomasii]SPT70966.1 Neu5Ac permease [Anaerobiospirillum thomasii]